MNRELTEHERTLRETFYKIRKELSDTQNDLEKSDSPQKFIEELEQMQEKLFQILMQAIDQDMFRQRFDKTIRKTIERTNSQEGLVKQIDESRKELRRLSNELKGILAIAIERAKSEDLEKIRDEFHKMRNEINRASNFWNKNAGIISLQVRDRQFIYHSAIYLIPKFVFREVISGGVGCLDWEIQLGICP